MPLRPNSDWNFRIFKKKDDVKKLNTAVSILVDWSGSMCSGNKKPLAVQAVTQCNKIFSDILHVPVEIAAFEYSRKPFHLIVKEFDKQITPVEIGQAFTYFDQFSSCNGDAHNVVCAAERLSRRKEKRKIILVMSDGQPSAGGDDPDAELRTVVKDLRNSGIDVYGIGMEDTSVTRYYGSNAKIVNNMSDISDVLLKTFQEDILEVCE
jgi:cobalamin biosynthesis protein CobT